MIVYDLVNYVIPSNIPKWYLHISFPLYPNCGSEPTKARLWLLQFAGVLAVAGWTHVLVDNGLAKADESDLKKLDRCARLLRQIVRYMLNLKSWGIPDPLWSPWLFQFCYNIIIYIYTYSNSWYKDLADLGDPQFRKAPFVVERCWKTSFL